MSSKFLSCLVVAWGVSVTHAAESCDSSFTERYRDSLQVVDSLRPDKGGQARVFSADGLEFTAGQARWMQGQLRKVEEACERGDQTRATQLMIEVQALLKSHRRASS